MNISIENPIRLLDLNKYPLNNEQVQNKQLKKWTQEVLYKFTPNSIYNSEYKNTVTRNIYNLPANRKLANYGARYFVMKQQCGLNEKEIEELRKEAINHYSPYWYGMISTCHYSAHITLKIAQLLFPESKWKIVNILFHHSFVTNIDVTTLQTFFTTHSYYDALPFMIDHATYDINAPMIIDILITTKSLFLGLIVPPSNYFSRFLYRPYKTYNESKKYRKNRIYDKDIIKIPKAKEKNIQEIVNNNHNNRSRNTTLNNKKNHKVTLNNKKKHRVTLKKCSNRTCSIMG